MTDVTLPRSGNAPLRFRGELLAESDGHRTGGQEHNRWHELALYRTQGGKYVVQIAYRTRWQGELDRDGVVVVDDPAAVRERLRSYDPTAPVIETGAGYPLGDAYADKQRRLLDGLRARFAQQVSDVLAAAGDELVEVIE